jgi:hypothetical protein
MLGVEMGVTSFEPGIPREEWSLPTGLPTPQAHMLLEVLDSLKEVSVKPLMKVTVACKMPQQGRCLQRLGS